MNIWIKNNWPRVLALNIAFTLIMWAVGCQPTVPSLVYPDQQLTRTQLQFEMETLIRAFELKNTELQQQEKLRRLITENALLIAQSGSFNPLGLITALAAFYGVGTVANDARKAVKNKIAKAKLDTF